MSDYLARFFLNPRTREQQRHLTTPWSEWVMGEKLIGHKGSLEIPPDYTDILAGQTNPRFFEQRFERAADGVAAFESLAAKAVSDGFFLTDITHYSEDFIPSDAKPKPQWQQDVDRFYLQVIAEDYGPEPPADARVQTEPMWLLSKARHTRREDKALAAKAVPFALTARDLIGRRKGEEDKFYSWSLSNIDVAGDVEQELFLCYADLNDAPNAFVAIREACDLRATPFRSENLALMQCFNFPQYREDAFEAAFTYAKFGREYGQRDGYEDIISTAGYAAFAKGRDEEIASGKGFVRWRAMSDPAPVEKIDAAEAEIGHKFPPDYRAQLAQRGRSQLAFYLKDDSSYLKFAAPGDLAVWGRVFQHWLDGSGDGDGVHSADWPTKFGVERRSLWSVATPWDNSSCMAICLAEGAAYGHCFLWRHEESYNLVRLGDSFDASVEALKSGFIAGDANIRSFFA
jgi:hypothetical protein